MIVSFVFNEDVQIILTPVGDDDYKLLDLALNGKKVREIRMPLRDSESQDRAVIVLTKEGAPRE